MTLSHFTISSQDSNGNAIETITAAEFFSEISLSTDQTSLEFTLRNWEDSLANVPTTDYGYQEFILQYNDSVDGQQINAIKNNDAIAQDSFRSNFSLGIPDGTFQVDYTNQLQFETNSNTLTVSFTEELDESSANDASFINRFKIYDRNFHATGFNAGNKPEPIDNAINNISINGKQIIFELNQNAIGRSPTDCSILSMSMSHIKTT